MIEKDYNWIVLFYEVSIYLKKIFESNESGYFLNILSESDQPGIKIAIDFTDEIFTSGINYEDPYKLNEYLENKNSGR